MKVRHRYWTIVAAVWGPFGGLAAAFYLAVISPEIARARQFEAELAKAKNLYAQAQEAAKKDNQTRMVQAVEKARDRVSDFVVPLEAAPDLAFDISQLASGTGVESFAMRPKNRSGLETTPTADRISEKHVDVSFTSPFPRFMSLVNALERHHPALFVETFTVSHPQTPSTDAQVNMELAVLIEKPPGN